MGTLCRVWDKLDSNGSGRADLPEFRAFARQHAKNLNQVNEVATRDFIAKLCDNVEKLLLEKKSSFAIEDLLKMVWPAAGASELKTMKRWVSETRELSAMHK